MQESVKESDAQVKLFTASDPDYQTIKSWLGGAKLGTTCSTGAN